MYVKYAVVVVICTLLISGAQYVAPMPRNLQV